MARMSSTEWIGASQVMRSLNGSSASRASVGLEVGVLEPGVRERLGDPAVEGRVGVGVDRRALVGALEVDRVDRAGLDQALDQGVVPVGRGVELEAQVRVAGEAAGDRVDRRRVAHARGDDERHRAQLAAERVGQRAAGLAQREVERRALERPSGGSCGRPRGRARRPGTGRARRGAREKLSKVHSPASGRTGPWSCWASWSVGLVGDVLAEALLAAALQADHRGEALEAARDGASRGLRARSRRS